MNRWWNRLSEGQRLGIRLTIAGIGAALIPIVGWLATLPPVGH